MSSKRVTSSSSMIDISNSESSDSVPRKRNVARGNKRVSTGTRFKQSVSAEKPELNIEDAGGSVMRPHSSSYHGVENIAVLQEEVLSWFEGIREKRGMPWRKRYDPALSMKEKGQRAYEIWVSEVMLQQTQVATVIAYWRTWIERWPTIADLAKADTEEVNAAWRGLGYYRRARSLLAGAKTVMSDPKYNGRLPDQPEVLEKEIEGVGRYTAGAICSMAYGVRTPIVDGNVHRLFARVLAIHAPQTAPATIKLLWASASELVGALPEAEGKDGIAGDWNQALMELGNQICKPVAPDCSICPLRNGCKAYAELAQPPPTPSPSSSSCTLCAPILSVVDVNRISSVTVFPMRKEKKVSRVEEEVVSVVEWQGGGGAKKWLFVKRPENGLLAGLFEPLTTTVSAGSDQTQRHETAIHALSTALDLPISTVSELVTSSREVGSIPHIFSHINMTYHIIHLIIAISTSSPPILSSGIWLDEAGVESANIGTGVKKVWAEIYGSWGNFDMVAKAVKPVKKARKAVISEGKIVKKVMMPAMPLKCQG